MSPLPISPGQGLAIGLCPEALGIVRLGGWRHARVDGHDLVTVEAPDVDGLAALNALDDWLQHHPAKASNLRRWWPAPARVVLSDRLVRYARLPWSDEALTRREDEALTLACFEERYGDMQGWTLNADPGGYGQGRLAAAVPNVLAEGLQRVLRRHGLASGDVSPYFAVCWNRWWRDVAKAVDKTSALFAVVDAETVVIGLVDGAGGWRALRRLRLADGATDLAELLAREAVLHGLAEQPPAWVHSPQSGLRAAANGKYQVLSSGADLPAPIVMALAGVQS